MRQFQVLAESTAGRSGVEGVIRGQEREMNLTLRPGRLVQVAVHL